MGLSQFGDLARSMVAGVALRANPAPSGAPHHTGAPVLRGSVEAGTFEDIFFRPLSRSEQANGRGTIKALVQLGMDLKREARAGKRVLRGYEVYLAGMTEKVGNVWVVLLSISSSCKGRVFPTYEYLMRETHYCRSTITRALNILEGVGLLSRQRRFKRKEATGPGPRWEQTSNAYRLALPKALMRLLPKWMQPAPIPSDEIQRQADREEEHDLMMKQLSCRDLGRMMASGQLGTVLANLGAGIDKLEREVAYHSQPLLDSFNKGKAELAYDGQRKLDAKWGQRRRSN